MAITTRSIVGVVIAGAIFADKTVAVTGAGTWPAGAVLATRASDGRMVRYNPGGAGGAEIPTAVLTQDLTHSATGNFAQRVLVAGQVRASKLVTSTEAALSDAQIDSLRSYGIIAQNVAELSSADNS